MPLKIAWQTPDCYAKAAILAKHLELPQATEPGLKWQDFHSSYALYVTESHLELVYRDSTSRISHLYTDFITGPLGYRRRLGGGKDQAIARAVGLKTYQKPIHILDATAGLGRDAFILACLGCRVHLIERSTVIAALLIDGLERAAQDARTASIIHSMHVTIADTKMVLQNELSNLPDVIYLDPMFPSRTKSALNKIEMRMIGDIVRNDHSEGDALLALALKKAKKRVVVKRSLEAPLLLQLEPNFVVKGKSNRYDIYLTSQKNQTV